MKKNDTVYLEDITKALQSIDEYMQNISYEQFINEDMRQDAVIRQLEIIGEAINKLSDQFAQQYPDFPLKQAIAMRNFLIHAYDDVDLEVVWATIQNDLPSLKEQLKQVHR